MQPTLNNMDPSTENMKILYFCKIIEQNPKTFTHNPDPWANFA